MNILIISHYIPPHMSVASLRIYKFVKYLKQNGHTIKILTTTKYNFDGEQSNPQDMEGIEIIEVPYAPFRYFDRFNAVASTKNRETENIITQKTNDSFIQKIKLQVRKVRKTIGSLLDIHDLWVYPAKKEGIQLYKSWKYNVIISSFGPPASHIVASRLKKEYSKVLWIADYRDLWSQNFNTSAQFPFSLIEQYFEKNSIQYADYLTTVSSPLKQKLEKLFPFKPIEVLYNGYDTLRETSFQKKNHKIVIIYTGNIYDNQDASKLFEAIDKMDSTKEIEINFYGGVNTTTQKLINRYGFANFYGKRPRGEILKLQERADILLLLEWTNPKQQGVLTGKLFEYLELKKPILCIGDHRNASANVIEELGIGNFCSTTKETISFINSFETYKVDIEKLYTYSFQKQIENLERIFNENL